MFARSRSLESDAGPGWWYLRVIASPFDLPDVLRFDTEAELAAWYAQGLALGTVLVPVHGAAELGEEFPLRLEVGSGGAYHALVQVTEIRAQGPPEVRARIRAADDLREFIDRFALMRRHGRLASAKEGRRQHDRFYTFLTVHFASFKQLGEYASNIGRGGMFVRCAEPPPMGTMVGLSLRLPTGESLDVDAKVVRVVTAEAAAASGGFPGVGVAFVGGAPGFSEHIDELLESYRSRPPHVLLVDDDLFFLATIGDQLREAGFKVELAQDGARALQMLVDYLYELDAVILDLQMPGLNGFDLVDRLRKLAGSLELRLVVLSGSDEQVLQQLVGSRAIDDAISKSLPPGQVVERIRALLRRH